MGGRPQGESKHMGMYGVHVGHMGVWDALRERALMSVVSDWNKTGCVKQLANGVYPAPTHQ